MARKQRIHYPGALYHVITRGNNREYIFRQRAEKQEYLKVIKQYKAKYDFLLYAYCIMDNHAHMLLEVADTPLNKIMQGIQQVFTFRYNKRFSRTGHVFEQRYSAKLCNKDEYLWQLIKYIHQNPVRADMEEGLSYEWSSHKEYLGGSILTDTSFPLSILDENGEKALKEYRVLIQAVGDNDLQLGEKVSGIKDGELFMVDCISSSQRGKKLSPEEIIEVVVAFSGIAWLEIYGNNKSRPVSDLRKIMILLLKKYTHLSHTEIAQMMGIGLSAVSNVLQPRYKKSLYFVSTLEELEKVLKAFGEVKA